MKTRAPPVTC